MSDATIIGYCRACGKPLDQETARNASGTIYCAEHVPVELPPQNAFASAPPPLPSANYPRVAPANMNGTHNSPPLAFVLGFIPGVGAVYNGQYAKGLVHVLVFGLIISILSNDAARGFEPLFGLLIPCFVFYMAFEAYHTARKREEGQPVDEFSSLFSANQAGLRFPVIAVLLIVFGVLFLLSNLDLLEFHRLLRYWPALLILLGAFMLYERLSGQRAASQLNASHLNSSSITHDRSGQ